MKYEDPDVPVNLHSLVIIVILKSVYRAALSDQTAWVHRVAWGLLLAKELDSFGFLRVILILDILCYRIYLSIQSNRLSKQCRPRSDAAECCI